MDPMTTRSGIIQTIPDHLKISDVPSYKPNGPSVPESVTDLVDHALVNTKKEINQFLIDGLGSQLVALVRNDVLNRLQHLGHHLNAVLSSKEITVQEVDSPKSKKQDRRNKVKVSNNTKGKNTIPTRGRFLLLDIRSMSDPFEDAHGRSFVSCKYADGIKRVYSLETIEKHKDALIRVLGVKTIRHVLKKL